MNMTNARAMGSNTEHRGEISGMTWAKFDCAADYDALDLMLGRSCFFSQL